MHCIAQLAFAQSFTALRSGFVLQPAPIGFSAQALQAASAVQSSNSTQQLMPRQSPQAGLFGVARPLSQITPPWVHSAWQLPWRQVISAS